MKSLNTITLLLLTLIIIANVFAIDTNDTCTFDINTNQIDCNSNTTLDENQVKFSNNGNIQFYLFASEGCIHCKDVENHLKLLEKDYDFNVIIIDVKTTQENIDLFVKIRNDFDIKSSGVPLLIINNKAYSGKSNIINNIESEFKNCKNKDCTLYVPGTKKLDVGIFEITALAITDSINPCELAVLLILLSAVLLKFSRKVVLEYGLTFITTIFICYFLMGVGLIFGFKLLSNYIAIGTTLFSIIFGILAIILGILNLKDAIAYGAGGFIMEVPMSWRPTMKKIIRNVTSIWSSIVIAIIVSVFLLPCTAGPYFLVSGLLHTKPWFEIIPWLLYYNAIFVLPMIIVMFIVYFGLSNIETIEEKRTKFIKIIHLIASVILIIMGIYLIVTTL